MEINFQPIGIIKTKFDKKEGIPIQARFGEDYQGIVELNPIYVEGLKDLDGFSHLHLIYNFHRHNDFSLIVKPYMDEVERGLFATRAPKRPNGIGLSLVELIKIEGNKIYFKGVDMLDGTPLLDIKPYYRDIDYRDNIRSGWLDKVKDRRTISDDRF